MFAPAMDDEIRFNNSTTICRNFLHKILGIFICQLLIATAFVTMATFHDPTRLCIKSHPYISIVASIITLGILIGLACSKNVRHKSRINFIFLFMVTLVLSFLLATYVSRYYPGQVLLALSFASLICFGITIFALQTKINLTMMGGFLMIALIVLLVASIVTLFSPDITMTLIIACMGAIIYSLYLIYVIQIVVNGNHEFFISPGDYIFATFTIYIDLMTTLFNLLTMTVLDD
ncbi:protein lifeguard 1-like [Metopolophium dirhodum]|uniref:protein lifeguard 1-like n=1 Tax=Metopolophium dirhodum TaxID=44670 RepID=UPI002990612B|nr:protein lifeguard 1-like [Metopolophium dirhodum]